MREESRTNLTRRGLLGAFAATAFTAAPTYSNAFGFLKGAGDIRTIRLYSTRSGESVNTVYWIEGNYIRDALKEINFLMRDWRSGRTINIDTHAIDIIAASQNVMDSEQPFLMLSGYRTPETNALLRSRSRSVARNSMHVEGRAADLRMQGRSVAQIARAATSFGAGGVGRYSRSNFVHVDSGPIRTWGR